MKQWDIDEVKDTLFWIVFGVSGIIMMYGPMAGTYGMIASVALTVFWLIIFPIIQEFSARRIRGKYFG